MILKLIAELWKAGGLTNIQHARQGHACAATLLSSDNQLLTAAELELSGAHQIL